MNEILKLADENILEWESRLKHIDELMEKPKPLQSRVLPSLLRARRKISTGEVEAELDEALAESFPASDPASLTQPHPHDRSQPASKKTAAIKPSNEEDIRKQRDVNPTLKEEQVKQKQQQEEKEVLGRHKNQGQKDHKGSRSNS